MMYVRNASYSVVVGFFFGLFSLSAAAQSTGEVAGQVVDDRSGEPLPGVSLTLREAEVGAVTDSTGRYQIGDVSPGRYSLRATFVGYRPAERTITVEPGQTTRVALSLELSTVEMRGIAVTALRPSMEPTGELQSEQIRNSEVADPGALLRDVPGVGAQRRGAMGLDPNVRGLSETEVGVYIGGMRTFPAGPARMDSPISHIDPSTVNGLEVVKGPYALTWGPSNMSAVRITQRGDDPPQTPLAGSVHTGYDDNGEAVETTGFAMGRGGAMFYSVNGAWRRGNDLTAGNGENISSGYESAEGRGRLGIELSARSTVSVTGSYQRQDDIEYPGRLLNADFFDTGMGQLEYQFAQETGSLRSVEIRATAQQTLHGMTNRGKPTFEAGTFPNGMDRPPLRIGVASEIQSYSGRTAARVVSGSGWNVTLGADVLHTFREATRALEVVMEDGSRSVPDFYTTDDGELLNKGWPGVTITQEGTFLKASRTFGSVTLTGTTRLDLAQSDARDPSTPFLQNAGVTADDLAQNDTMLNGALTISTSLTNQWTLSLGAGSVARPPSALERYSDRFPATKTQMSAEFQGVPSLQPERSTQGDLWLEGQGTQWTVNVNGFARYVDNYVTLAATQIDPILPLSPSTVYRYTNGEATFFGSELNASTVLSEAWTLRVSGSYLWGRDETRDEPAFGVSPPSGTVGLRWSPSMGQSRVSNLFIDGRANLVMEQDRVAETRGERATEGYTTVDVQVGTRLLQAVELNVGVQNILDVMYTDHLNATNPFAGTRVPEPGRTFTTNVTVHF